MLCLRMTVHCVPHFVNKAGTVIVLRTTMRCTFLSVNDLEIQMHIYICLNAKYNPLKWRFNYWCPSSPVSGYTVPQENRLWTGITKHALPFPLGLGANLTSSEQENLHFQSSIPKYTAVWWGSKGCCALYTNTDGVNGKAEEQSN